MVHSSTYTIFDVPNASCLPGLNVRKEVTATTSSFPIVWVIDDDGFANFIAERTLNQTHFAQEVVTFTAVEDALKMLDRAVASKPELLPSVIFLDLNMPLLNGWDFLYAYEQLPEFVRNHCSLYVLSGTENANALVRSRRARNVRACLSKPLSNEDLEVIKLQATGNWE